MTSQMDSYLTILQAAERTGKSQSAITRLVKQYKGSKHVKKDGKKYLISIEVLPQLISNYSFDYSANSQMNSLIEAKNETISLLKNQLEKKDYTIEMLIERNREANIIIKSLQEQTRLPERAESIIHDVKPEQEKVKKSKPTNTPLIMQLYSEGLNYKEIAEELNKRKKTNQFGKKYNDNAIKTTVSRNK